MVGALADWFAVTALFRHPLGCLCRTRRSSPAQERDRRNLQESVTENFLTQEIAATGWPRRGSVSGSGCGSGSGTPAGCAPRSCGCARRAGRISDDEVPALVEDFLVPRLVEEPVAPIAGSLLEGIVDEKTHHGSSTSASSNCAPSSPRTPEPMPPCSASGRRRRRRRGSTTG